jgi:hypothetical protein
VPGCAAQEPRKISKPQRGGSAATVLQPPPQQYPAPVAPAPPDDMAGRLANLTRLGELMNAGLLTHAGFDQQKARILNSRAPPLPARPVTERTRRDPGT